MKKEIKYTICNPVVFAEVMENPEICRRLLERILPEKKIRQLKFICAEEDELQLDAQRTIMEAVPQTEKAIGAGLEAKSIRLDVLFEGENEWYDIEMQVHNVDHPPKRSRYYHAVKAVTSLKKGDLYHTLRPGYVIFICMFDYFGKNKPVYSFRMWDEKNSLPLDDGQVTIFLNGICAEDIPKELDGFYRYLQTGIADSEDEFVRMMDAAVIEANQREEVRYRVTLYDEMQRLNTLLEMTKAELNEMEKKVAEQAAIAEEQTARAAEQAAIAEEQTAIAEEQTARAAEQAAIAEAQAKRMKDLTIWLLERNRGDDLLTALKDDAYFRKLLEDAEL